MAKRKPQKQNKFNIAGNWDERILIGLLTIFSLILAGTGSWFMFSAIREWVSSTYQPSLLQEFLIGFSMLLFFYVVYKTVLIKKMERWIKIKF